MEKLTGAIKQSDCLMAGLQLASLFQPGEFQPKEYLCELKKWAKQAQDYIDSPLRNLSSFQKFIRFFYVEMAFSGDEKEHFSTQHNLLNQVIDYRTGIPVTLAIIFKDLARRLEFEVYGVNFPGHFLIKCIIDSKTNIYLDPLNGKVLSRADLKRLYFAILNEVEDEIMPEEALNSASCSETIIRLLHNLKASFIKNKSYSQALDAVQLLVELCPNDPYERRDRGFLLHQLDCTQVAIADYQYFIRKCPEDPSSQLLQAQLQQLAEEIPKTLH
ncbi:SirB1 family protein [Paraglaciecola sp.]|uniref:SirB1 family protein n=1 Tax=Paraglaciecola sp. TaxID=1920173 RepID=UPI003EF1879E